MNEDILTEVLELRKNGLGPCKECVVRMCCTGICEEAKLLVHWRSTLEKLATAEESFEDLKWGDLIF